jgi:hypothetical protein
MTVIFMEVLLGLEQHVGCDGGTLEVASKEINRRKADALDRKSG